MDDGTYGGVGLGPTYHFLRADVRPERGFDLILSSSPTINSNIALTTNAMDLVFFANGESFSSEPPKAAGADVYLQSYHLSSWTALCVESKA